MKPPTETDIDAAFQHGLWLRTIASPLGSESRMLADLAFEVTRLREDKARLDWLAAHPLRSEIKGGSDDGHTGNFWGCGSANLSLRETIDTISALKSRERPDNS